jgi:hypothetical protein
MKPLRWDRRFRLSRTRTRSGAVLFILISTSLLFTACNQLPRELRTQIETADNNLLQAEKDFQHTNAEVLDDIKRTPDLFTGTAVATEWPNALRAAKARLDAAERDRVQLQKLKGDKESIARARRLLTEEDHLRKQAIDEANAVEAQANRWLDFHRNLPHYLARMREEHDAAHTADLTSVKQTVAKAELDWPNKKDDLERRLTSLENAPEHAEAEWQSSFAARDAAANGKPTGAQIATLIEADNALSAASHLQTQADDLTARCGQLYVAWDKILEDLDNEHGDYREKVKLVKTRGTNVSTNTEWDDVSPAAYHAVENDLGMAIAHKDAGLYDSEAVNVAQPPGYAYIAPPSVGSNQYGYWTHTSEGSFWTFLPQYLIMRELFWGHSYRPIVVNEYNSYYSAQRVGRSWYGQTSPAAPPRYGTQGTFTQQRYAGSRYVQSGGFKNSGYASRQTAAPQSSPQPHFGNAPGSSSQGKRFGNGAGSPPAGRRFGSPGGGSRPSGKSFGRRR